MLFQVDKDRSEPGEPIVEVDGIHLESVTGRGSLKGLSLAVHAGEIVGLAGVSGNGQSALFDALVGVDKPSRGAIRIVGVETNDLSANRIAQLGVASVPADRIAQGLLMDFRVKENLVLGRHRGPPFSRGGLLNRRSIDAFAAESIEGFDIRTPSASHTTRTLSGGNLQKIIMARELSGSRSCWWLTSPPAGWTSLQASTSAGAWSENGTGGAGVLLMSEDLDEIFQLSDRIAVIYDGRIVTVTTRR